MERRAVTVRMFSLLREGRAERGLPTETSVHVPEGGCPALDIARDLELDPAAIEGVFVNHVVYGLEQVVMPGDSIAFVPFGTPGPHRFFLGLFDAGRR